MEADTLLRWIPPEFPVMAIDLMARGLEGPELGTTLRAMQILWDESDYRLTKAQLMDTVRPDWEREG